MSFGPFYRECRLKHFPYIEKSFNFYRKAEYWDPYTLAKLPDFSSEHELLGDTRKAWLLLANLCSKLTNRLTV